MVKIYRSALVSALCFFGPHQIASAATAFDPADYVAANAFTSLSSYYASAIIWATGVLNAKASQIENDATTAATGKPNVDLKSQTVTTTINKKAFDDKLSSLKSTPFFTTDRAYSSADTITYTSAPLIEFYGYGQKTVIYSVSANFITNSYALNVTGDVSAGGSESFSIGGYHGTFTLDQAVSSLTEAVAFSWTHEWKSISGDSTTQKPLSTVLDKLQLGGQSVTITGVPGPVAGGGLPVAFMGLGALGFYRLSRKRAA